MNEIEKIRKMFNEFIEKTSLTPNLLVIPLSTFENWDNHAIFKELHELNRYFLGTYDSHILGMKIIRTTDFPECNVGLGGSLGHPFVCYTPYLNK